MLYETDSYPDSADIMVTSTERVGSKDCNSCYGSIPSFFNGDYKAMTDPSRKVMSGFVKESFRGSLHTLYDRMNRGDDKLFHPYYFIT
jgi:hypothetical protein